MPELSRFFGIVIAMYHRDHPPPHFHARYGEYEAKFSVETGEIREGNLPRRARLLVEEWYALHTDELAVAWRLIENRLIPAKIDPLE